MQNSPPGLTATLISESISDSARGQAKAAQMSLDVKKHESVAKPGLSYATLNLAQA